MPDRERGFDHRNYVNFDNTMPENPKILALSDAGFRALFDAICYCNRQETDGKITGPALKTIGSNRARNELISRGHLEPHPCEEGAWLVHDYLGHNRSKAELDYLRKAKSASGSLGTHARWHVARRQYLASCEHCVAEEGSAHAG